VLRRLVILQPRSLDELRDVRLAWALDGILTRMQAHQKKKSTVLRHLSLADRFLDAPPPAGTLLA
jgi:hypothetical protein